MTPKTEAATTKSRPRVAAPFGWRTVTPLVTGSALNPINSSVIATALVPIAAALHVPVGRTSILVSSLYLACAIAQPTGHGRPTTRPGRVPADDHLLRAQRTKGLASALLRSAFIRAVVTHRRMPATRMSGAAAMRRHH